VRRALALAIVVGCGQAAPPANAIVVVADAAPPATAPVATDAPAAAKPPPSIVVAPAPTFDGSRRAPGMARLRAVGKDAAWLEFDSPGDKVSYGAVVDLATLCVTETTAGENVPVIEHLFGRARDDQDVIDRLESPEIQKKLGEHLGFVERFEEMVISAVPVRGAHSSGKYATTAARDKVAFSAGGRVFVSLDGGHRFTGVDDGQLATTEDVRFTPDGRFLTYEALWQHERDPHISFVSIDVSGARPVVAGRLDLANHTLLRPATADGKRLVTHDKERCVFSMDPAQKPLALTKLTCVPGPKTPPDHFFFVQPSPSGAWGLVIDGDFQFTKGTMFRFDGSAPSRVLPGALDLHNDSAGPDDGGRFAWDRVQGERISTADGTFDHGHLGTALGFDLEGRFLSFVQPPLVAPHKPMTMMPPTKDKLEDVKCQLVSRTDPTTGKRAR
jgi:hypothetical protein